MKNELKHICEAILGSSSEHEELKNVRLLSSFFERVTDGLLPERIAEKNKDTTISGGIALSPRHAADCLYDFRRTARFIKGTYKAIHELFNRFPAQKINILYAGCGPYATIILPLLPLFSPGEIGVTLLDINDYSVLSVSEIIPALGLKEYIDEVVNTDAVQYKYRQDKPLHMLVTETMFRALIREPQVAITAKLAPQLIKNGILIPEDISLDLGCTFFVKERYFGNEYMKPDAGLENIIKQPPRLQLGHLFSLGLDNNFSRYVADNSFQFESNHFKSPGSFEQYPDACIFTRIKIFSDIELNSSEALITDPYCINSLYNIGPSVYFRVIYNFKDIPCWKLELKGENS